MTKIYNEAGVNYTFSDPERFFTFTEHTYTAWYLPNDERFNCAVWIEGSRPKMLELINAWNQKDPKRWHYIL